MDDFTRFSLLFKIIFHFENFRTTLLYCALLNTNCQNKIKNFKGFFYNEISRKDDKKFRHSSLCSFFYRDIKK
jgi:hypothetical protein